MPSAMHSPSLEVQDLLVVELIIIITARTAREPLPGGKRAGRSLAEASDDDDFLTRKRDPEVSRLDEIRAIAGAVLEQRPDWDFGGVQKSLWDLRGRGDFEQLRAAALRATRNPQARTPASIAWESSWREDGPDTDQRPVPFVPLPECVDCGHPVRRGQAPARCPGCGLPWTPLQHDPIQPERLSSEDISAFAERARRRAGDIRTMLRSTRSQREEAMP